MPEQPNLQAFISKINKLLRLGLLFYLSHKLYKNLSLFLDCLTTFVKKIAFFWTFKYPLKYLYGYRITESFLKKKIIILSIKKTRTFS